MINVLKFGGTSMANATNIKKVVEIVKQYNNSKTIVVVSALSGITDTLIQMGIDASIGNNNYTNILKHIQQQHIQAINELIVNKEQNNLAIQAINEEFNVLASICEGVFKLQELSARTKDKIVSFGELLSSKIITAYIESLDINVYWIDSRQVIKTDDTFGNALVNFTITNANISNLIKEKTSHSLFIAPGFISSNSNNFTTTLGRGGSDYTAAIFAAAIHANNLEIWTDVSGMMTADPRWVANVKNIKHITYKEAMELSHFGAKVIYPPTIAPAMQLNIPIWVKNTFAPQDYGTKITSITEFNTENDAVITGISSINHVSLLSLEGSGMVGIPGFSKRLFEALAAEKINVIIITQSSSEHSICVGINTADVDKAKATIDNAFEYEINIKRVEPLVVEKNLSVVAVVGDKMKSHQGISGKMFAALGRNGINVRAIAQGSSERNITAVVNYNDVKKAINVLHEAFFESSKKQLNVFIAGVGNVGKKLLQQIKQQQSYLASEHNLVVKVVGLANSKQFLIQEDGINLDNWETSLSQTAENSISKYVDDIINLNLRNTVFVDVTANANVANTYPSFLQKSIAVVACNKIAASSTYQNYSSLKNLSKEFNAPFLFETNVGAGLPVIDTLSNLIKSGDEIVKIEAVLSGTLNFVFNNYNATTSFASVVKQAQDEGYTEPDPRLDLGGTDVMRKIMILAREAGYEIEMDSITNNGFLPKECFNGSVEDFYASMEKQETHFKNLFEDANQKGCKLKFVATYNEGNCSVGLQAVNETSDFYHLYGKDNIVLFYTKRYNNQPLVIKGAGAGADVTASGVFADIIRVSSSV
ncbi:MAG: bifunctional aspartate kinase/homoserine dehydrogenase I [Chitinophagaceae bacterium]